MTKVEPLQQLEERFTEFLCKIRAKLLARSKSGRYDENKISEYMMRDILNTLYGYRLDVEPVSNSAGFDLCSDEDRLMVQVTSECTDAKVFDCLDKTVRRIRRQPRLAHYRLMVLFMTTDTAQTQKVRSLVLRGLRSAETDLSLLRFDPQTDIIDFNTLCNELWSLDFTPRQMADLQTLLDKYEGFAAGQPETDRVQEILGQYVDNYRAPLFMHRNIPDTKITLQNLYIEPSVTDAGDLSGWKYPFSEILLDYLWKRPQEGILLIQGDAAIGKTSLVSWMCHQHQILHGELFGDLPLVCVRLRELEFEGGDLSARALLRYLDLSGTQEFQSRYPNAVVVLDGADELGLVSNYAPNAIAEFILNVRQELQIQKLIVTTRPQFVQADVLQSRLFRTREVTLTHFGHRKRMAWLEKYTENGAEVSRQTLDYISSLDRDEASGVADTPLALYLLASCDVSEDLQGNIWALYHEIFSNAILKTYYNNAAVWSSPAMLDDGRASLNYRMVQEIAFRMFRKSDSERFWIDQDELDEAARAAGLEGATADTVKETCVLCAYWKRRDTGALEFYHNNIRAFFFCEYICAHLSEALDRFSRDSDWNSLIHEFCRIFSWGRITQTTWQQVFTFLCLRLRAEGRRPGDRSTLLWKLKNEPRFQDFALQLINSSSIWTFPYHDHSYRCAKMVFTNCIILFHLIFEEVYRKNAENAPCIRLPNAGNLLCHWYRLFLERPHIPPVGYVGLLSHTDLFSIPWTDLTFREADFTGSILTSVDFTDGKILGGFFSDSILVEVDFHRTCLQGVNFMDTSIDRTNFRKCNLTASTLCDSKIDNSHFAYAALQTVQINHSSFTDCTFPYTALESVQEQGVRYQRCRFSSTGFTGVDLTDCVFTDCVFRNARFQQTRMLSCHIEGMETRLEGSEFDNIQFHGCTYRNVSPWTEKKLQALGFTRID